MNVMSKEYFEYLEKAYTKIDVNKYYGKYIITDIERHSCVLDIGCGLGLFLQKLSSTTENASLIGVDVNIYALRYARRIAPSVHLIRGAADKLPFPSKKFDAIFALDLIEHLRSPSDFLKGVHTVLADNGSLILSTPDKYSIYHARGKNILERAFFHIMRILGFVKLDPTHIKEFTMSELSKLLHLNKFVLVKYNGYTARFIPLHKMNSIVVCCQKLELVT